MCVFRQKQYDPLRFRRRQISEQSRKFSESRVYQDRNRPSGFSRARGVRVNVRAAIRRSWLLAARATAMLDVDPLEAALFARFAADAQDGRGLNIRRNVDREKCSWG